LESGAALWVHGHTHEAMHYEIGQTRVVSNCGGGDIAVQKGFRPDLVVEI